MAFVDELLAIRSTSEFIIYVEEHEAQHGSDSLDDVCRYLATHHPEILTMVEGGRNWRR